MESIKIQAGKRYVRRDGKVSSVITTCSDSDKYPFQDEDDCKSYTATGRWFDGHVNSCDLIGEYNVVAQHTTPEIYASCHQQEGGLKFDAGKLQFSCLTRGLALPLRAVAAVLTYGAVKYARDSWQTVPDAKRRYEDALDRHLNAWKSGEQRDDESGMLHLAHAACNALFLLWFEITENKIDVTKFNNPKGNKDA